MASGSDRGRAPWRPCRGLAVAARRGGRRGAARRAGQAIRRLAGLRRAPRSGEGVGCRRRIGGGAVSGETSPPGGRRPRSGWARGGPHYPRGGGGCRPSGARSTRGAWTAGTTGRPRSSWRAARSAGGDRAGGGPGGRNLLAPRRLGDRAARGASGQADAGDAGGNARRAHHGAAGVELWAAADQRAGDAGILSASMTMTTAPRSSPTSSLMSGAAETV